MATVVTPADGQSKVGSGTPRRRFRLLDAMILVAATALACALMLWMERASEGAFSWSGIPELIIDYAHQPPVTIDNHIRLMDVWKGTTVLLLILTLPCFTLWTLALIPIRLLAPRPRFRRLASQPGWSATIAFGVAALFMMIQSLTIGVISGWNLNLESLDEKSSLALSLLVAAPSYPGFAVLVSWLSLLVGRRWHAQRSWIDRLGRLLGVYWVAVSFVYSFVYYFCFVP
jgi:hypothetical protein